MGVGPSPSRPKTQVLDASTGATRVNPDQPPYNLAPIHGCLIVIVSIVIFWGGLVAVVLAVAR